MTPSSKRVPQDNYFFRNFVVDVNTPRQVSIPSTLPQRPAKFNANGKEATVVLNTFNVTQAPDREVHQYDVSSL